MRGGIIFNLNGHITHIYIYIYIYMCVYVYKKKYQSCHVYLYTSRNPALTGFYQNLITKP